MIGRGLSLQTVPNRLHGDKICLLDEFESVAAGNEVGPPVYLHNNEGCLLLSVEFYLVTAPYSKRYRGRVSRRRIYGFQDSLQPAQRTSHEWGLGAISWLREGITNGAERMENYVRILLGPHDING